MSETTEPTQGATRRANARRKRAGRPRMAGDVKLSIENIARSPEGKRLSPVQIRRWLQGQERYKDRLPSLRSVQRIVSLYRSTDASGWWSLADADPDDAALVLPVLVEAMERSEGHWQRFSNALAQWIARVCTAAPDLPPWWALHVGQSYWSHLRHDETTEGLDQMLAFAPWRDKSHLRRYLRAVEMSHGDWFELLDTDWEAGPIVRLAGGVPWDPRAAGLLIALYCWEIPEEKGTSND